MSKFSELDSDRQQIERLTDVAPPPSFAQTARAGAHTPTPWIEVGSHDFRGADMALVGMVNPTVKQGKIDRAFIVAAVNNHEALVKALEGTYRTIIRLTQQDHNDLINDQARGVCSFREVEARAKIFSDTVSALHAMRDDAGKAGSGS